MLIVSISSGKGTNEYSNEAASTTYDPLPQEDDDNDEEKIINPSGCPYIENNPPYDFGLTKNPQSAFLLGSNNFLRQGSFIITDILENWKRKNSSSSSSQKNDTNGNTNSSYISLNDRPPYCFGFTLNDEAVKEAEHRRISKPSSGLGKVETNPASQFLYDVGCLALDELFPGRPIPRFWFLETIARMPYFSYVSMLHLYESFGWLRDPELRKIHYAEEDNELHHLLIMEALGGNALWKDRFLGYHTAIVYYWAVCLLYLITPKAAYEFMALLEAHAVDTYSTFFKENEERLKSLPAPNVAISYYKSADLYLFDDFQVSKSPNTRRPPCDTLYHVFKNICEDETEHVKTMRACMDYTQVGNNIVESPHNRYDENGMGIDEKRKAWLNWSEEVNRACTSEEDF